MPSQSLQVTANIDLDPWVHLAKKQLPHNPDGLSASIVRIGLLPDGTQGGRSTVMMEIELPNGDTVIAETTLRLFRLAATSLLAAPQAQMEEMDL